MDELKCTVCNKKSNWFYHDKKHCGFYCDEHLPCGRFKRFMGKYIVPIISEIVFRYKL